MNYIISYLAKANRVRDKGVFIILMVGCRKKKLVEGAAPYHLQKSLSFSSFTHAIESRQLSATRKTNIEMSQAWRALRRFRTAMPWTPRLVRRDRSAFQEGLPFTKLSQPLSWPSTITGGPFLP